VRTRATIPDALPELILYNYWRSSSSHRVRIALALKRLEYEYVAIDLLHGEQSSDAHTARSPTGYVPCLLLDGVPHVESVAIVELLDERFPSPQLYPGSPHHRARVRTLVEIINSGTQPFQNRHVLLHLSPDPRAQKAWVAHFVERGLRAFERAMEANSHEGIRGPYACGGEPTAADAFLVPQVHAAARFGVDLAHVPRVRAAFEAASQLDAVRQAAPEQQPDAPKG
jgi:maleylpyruvate isomerase